MRRLLVVLALAAPALAAQDITPGDDLDRLDAEIRASALAEEIYYLQLRAAYDLALIDGRYARADSVALLARLAWERTYDLPVESTAWPSSLDALALRFLRADRAALEWIAAGGRWWGGFTDPWLYGQGRYLPRRGPERVSPAMREALARDASRALDLLVQNGATPEEAAAASLAMAYLAGTPAPSSMVPSGISVEDQRRLNEGADRFLAQYPESRFGRFIRERIRYRTRPSGAFVLYLDMGGLYPEGELDTGTISQVALNIGLGLRERVWHADATVRGAILEVGETRSNEGGERLVEGERLGIYLLGLSGGPRLSVGNLDVLPYATVGVMAQDVYSEEQDEPLLSSYEPPTTPGVGYGLALEYVFGRARPEWGERFGIRASVNRLHPRFNRGFEDLLGGGTTTVTLGVAIALVDHERMD